MGDLYEGGATGLNGLDLGSTESGTAEARRELRHVESNAVGGMDRAEAGARGTANATFSTNGLLQGTVLLGVVAVGAEGGVCGIGRTIAVVGETLGERSGRRGRVSLGGVIDVGRDGARTKELDERDALGVDSGLSKSSSSGEHYGGCLRVVVMVNWSVVVVEGRDGRDRERRVELGEGRELGQVGLIYQVGRDEDGARGREIENGRIWIGRGKEVAGESLSGLTFDLL